MATAKDGGIDSEALHVHQTERHGQPLNAEIKSKEIINSFITPTEKLFHRNHDDIIHVPQGTKAVEEEWKISLDVEHEVLQGGVRSGIFDKAWQRTPSRSFTYGELLHATGSCEGVKKLEATATLECAGNRRQDLAEQEKAEGIQWGSGAISTAAWQGASVRDLLIKQGIPDPFAHHNGEIESLLPSGPAIQRDCASWAKHLHLHMLSAQPTSESDHSQGEYFAASIPLPTAMHPQQRCILAMHQNNNILTQSHGFPLRVVVPGHVGARWVKWLRGLRISSHENDSPPMRKDYKMLTPSSTATEQEKRDWKDRMMNGDSSLREKELSVNDPLQNLGVGSSIEQPQDNDEFDGGAIDVEGYAVGTEGSPVSRVEVIVIEQKDTEETMHDLRVRAEGVQAWTEAIVQTENDVTSTNGKQHKSDTPDVSWAWSLFSAKLSLPSHNAGGPFAIVARATTASGVAQERESEWNVRGFGTRSWPVVRNLRRSNGEITSQ